MPAKTRGVTIASSHIGAIMAVSATLLAMCLASGCSVLPRPTAASPSSSPTPKSIPTPFATWLAPTATLVSQSVPPTLTLWLPPEMLPDAQHTGQLIRELNQAFVAANPQTRIEIVPKAPYGLGGIANMLLTTHAVVPGRLPDIVAIDTSELHKVAESDILVPLDKFFNEAEWDDLFPWALETVTVNGKRLAMPFQTDIIFLVYDASVVQTPPRAWYDLASTKGKYIFPAGRGDGSSADAFLLHYLALGGTLGDNNARPALDTALAARVLRDYRSAMELGIVPDTVRTMRTLDDCWMSYVAGEASLTHASSQQFARDRSALQNARYAPIPTINGKTITLARSWAWAIVASDPARQELAARYIALALRPEYLSTWSKLSFHLPVHRSVLALAIEDTDYREFLIQQLQHARPYPNGRHFAEIQDVISIAIEDVLDGATTPERAAITAAAALARLR